MTSSKSPRIVYSYPFKLGASRICYTAWQLVNSAANAGANLLVFPGALQKPLASGVAVRPTLARGKLRLPYRALGTMRTLAVHDYIVSRRLEKMVGEVDVVHCWPSASVRTLQTAKRLGIATVLERPNAHTRFAYEVVQKECNRIGVQLPANHEHAFKADMLAREEKEFDLAYRLLCPSDFVVQTFMDKGFRADKLVRHQYGYDEKTFRPGERSANSKEGLTVLFAGGCAPRKGLHFALDAWLRSPAHETGKFLIAGEFVPGYAEFLSAQLADPSVHVLGHRSDMAALMQSSDALILPTIEEGSALVTYEARGCGCVLVVSDASGAVCRHMENALVHRAGDVDTLMQHISLLAADRGLLEKLRAASMATVSEINWAAAGRRLAEVYREVLGAKQRGAV
jgi:glycosyltransferase involved in cell wall biosynthesis